MKATEIVERLNQRFPNEPEYIQAVSQVLGTIEDEYNRHPEFDRANLIERLCIPDRIISFRVTWVDDKGQRADQYGLSHSAQQRHRSVQGRHSLSFFRQSLHPLSSLPSSRPSRMRSPRCRWEAPRAVPTSLRVARAMLR